MLRLCTSKVLSEGSHLAGFFDYHSLLLLESHHEEAFLLLSDACSLVQGQVQSRYLRNAMKMQSLIFEILGWISYLNLFRYQAHRHTQIPNHLHRFLGLQTTKN